MLQLNASEASWKKIEIELSRANILWYNASEASRKKLKLNCRERSDRIFFLENLALFPPILAS